VTVISPKLWALVAWCGVVFAAPALAGPWQCATTAHFTLYAAGAPDSVSRMARDLERMAELLAGEGMGTTSRVRPHVFLIGFPDRKSFEPHQPMQNGRRVALSGYAETTPYAHWIGYIAGEEEGRWTANHEFVHTVAAELFQSVPLCLNEGLAEFYSTSTPDDRGVRFGHLIPWHRETLRSGEPFTLDQLFGSKARELAYAGGRSSAMFYAESWCLVHYLMSEKGGAERLRRFAVLTAGGTPAREAMASVYPEESWEGFPSRLKHHVDVDERDFQTFEIPLARPLADIHVDLRVARPAEVAVHTGLWRMQPSGADQTLTRDLFEQARNDPKTEALAADGFGLLALDGQRSREAEKEFRFAATRSLAEPLALSIAGAGLLQVAGQDTAGRRARIDEAIGILERAIDRDSLDARALAWYGEGSVMAGYATPKALAALERASTSLGADAQLAKALDTARKSTALAARGVPSGAAANDSLNARVATGRYDAALSLLDELEKATTDEGYRQKLRDNRAQVERLRDHNRAVDAYNRGVDALERHDFVTAAREFDSARASGGDPELEKSASERLEEIPSFEAFQHGLDALKKNNWSAALSAFEHARALAKNDELRQACDKNIAQLKPMVAKKPAH